MSIRRLPEGLLWLVLAAAWPSALVAADSEASQRERIARDRAAIESDAQTAQKRCAQRFAVTDCVDRVKAERRQRLQPLDRELAALDDAQRKRRAAERMAQIQQRQASQVDVKPEVSVHKRKAVASEPAGPVNAASESVEPDVRSGAQAPAAQAEAEAAKRAAASARRAEKAKTHRLEVEQRNAERAKQGSPPASLPVPPAPAASR